MKKTLPQKVLIALQWLEVRYGLDVRSLALFRIGIALVLLADLWIRGQDISAFYTDFGTLPRMELLSYESTPWQISLHMAGGEAWFQILLFSINALIAFMLLIGYRTKLATFLAWVFFTSLMARNPQVVHGGDFLMRVLLFFAIFLPLGTSYSVDRALDSSEKPFDPRRIFSGASCAIMAQIAILYCFAAVVKSDPIWRTDGTAVWYALNIEQLTTPLGQYLLNFPDLLYVLSFSALYLEQFGCLLFISPFFSGPLRTLAVLLFAGLHLGFAATMELGTFPWTDIFAVSILLPTWFWDHLSAWVRSPHAQPLSIYYDGDCGFCKKTVHLLRTFLMLPRTPIHKAQDHEPIEKAMEEKNSWVVVDEAGQYHYQFQALILLVRTAPVFWPLASLLNLSPLRQFGTTLYRLVAGNRGSVSKLTAWMRFRPYQIRISPLTNAISFFLMVYVFLWNYDAVYGIPGAPRRLPQMAYILQLDQYWGMFAPHPLKWDGWFVMPGKLLDGSTVDVMRGKTSVAWEKPTHQPFDYKDERWRKFMMLLYMSHIAKDQHRTLENYANYMCRNWNKPMKDDLNHQLSEFDIYFFNEWTVPPGQTPNPPRKELLLHHSCIHSLWDSPN